MGSVRLIVPRSDDRTCVRSDLGFHVRERRVRAAACIVRQRHHPPVGAHDSHDDRCFSPKRVSDPTLAATLGEEAPCSRGGVVVSRVSPSPRWVVNFLIESSLDLSGY